MKNEFDDIELSQEEIRMMLERDQPDDSKPPVGERVDLLELESEDLKTQSEMLKECILEMSEIVYGG